MLTKFLKFPRENLALPLELFALFMHVRYPGNIIIITLIIRYIFTVVFFFSYDTNEDYNDNANISSHRLVFSAMFLRH